MPCKIVWLWARLLSGNHSRSVKSNDFINASLTYSILTDLCVTMHSSKGLIHQNIPGSDPGPHHLVTGHYLSHDVK